MSQAVAISDEMKHDIRKLRDFGLDLLNVEKPTLVTTEALGLLASATEAIHKIIDGFEKPRTVDSSSCMVKSCNDGGQAFPGGVSAGYDPRDGKEHHPGMSLRDYFAGQVLGQIAIDMYDFHSMAQDAYKIADAMLTVRSKQIESSTAGQPAAAPGQAGSLSDGG